MQNTFNLQKLLRDVFAPRTGENVLILIDEPHGTMRDTEDWAERRRMADEWREGFRKLGCNTFPLVRFPATGANNSQLPDTGIMEGKSVTIAELLSQSQITVAMTQFSATAPLERYVMTLDALRVASMPGVLRCMEQTALAADYSVVGPRTHILADILTRAERADVEFDTGHRFTFDLRYRKGIADDGSCIPDKNDKELRLINLPSGEAFTVPYEGERDGEPSRTGGEIPVCRDSQTAILRVEQNRVVRVGGSNALADYFRREFDEDPVRGNIAELGLGCNEWAVVSGNVLEDEKAGFHFAYGRSDHFVGGTTGPEGKFHFKSPATVLHEDIVYAPGCPIGIRSLTLVYENGKSELIMKDSRYCVF